MRRISHAFSYFSSRRADTTPSESKIKKLFLAAITGDLPTVKRYIRKYPGHIDVRRGDESYTALTAAVLKHRMDVVDALLDAGASDDARDANNLSPRKYAEANGYKDIIDLMDKKAEERAAKAKARQEQKAAARLIKKTL